MDCYFASSNTHKISELRAILPPTMRLKSLKDCGIETNIPETGKTLAENSLIKAQYFCELLKERGLNGYVIADDSGLETEALNGAPGVYSARYAGEPANDTANNKKLLQELKNITNRRARFVTVITLIQPSGETRSFEGEVKGTIAHEPRGCQGFGYDPLFIPQGYRSTFAELGSEVKNAISHRALALKKLMDFLNFS